MARILPARRLITLSFILINLAAHQAMAEDSDMTILRMSPAHRQNLFSHLDNTPCPCGCGMSVAQCLHEDPFCEEAPKVAKNAIQQFKAAQEANDGRQEEDNSGASRTMINSSQNGSVVSGQLDGRECTFASVGGTTVKLCD